MPSNRDVTAGTAVFVEFFDRQGNCVAQALFLPWKSRLLPALGDRLNCKARKTSTGRTQRYSGLVRCREFDIQTSETGVPQIWVRLEVQLGQRASAAQHGKRGWNATRIQFSDN